MVNPLSNVTPRLWADLQRGMSPWPCFSLIFVQLKLVVDGPLLYVTNTVLHVAEKRTSAGERS